MTCPFSLDQIASLSAPFDRVTVGQRRQGRSQVSYLEGWPVIAEANRIVGFDGWQREAVTMRCVHQVERPIASASGAATTGSRRSSFSTTKPKEPLHSNGPDPTRLPPTAQAACLCKWPLASPPMRHSLGRVVATAAVAASVPEAVIIGLLDRHAAGDWGDLDVEDRAANHADHSQARGRLFSSYATEEHGTIWVITEDLRGEADGPITTVLFPDDY